MLKKQCCNLLQCSGLCSFYGKLTVGVHNKSLVVSGQDCQPRGWGFKPHQGRKLFQYFCSICAPCQIRYNEYQTNCVCDRPTKKCQLFVDANSLKGCKQLQENITTSKTSYCVSWTNSSNVIQQSTLLETRALPVDSRTVRGALLASDFSLRKDFANASFRIAALLLVWLPLSIPGLLSRVTPAPLAVALFVELSAGVLSTERAVKLLAVPTPLLVDELWYLDRSALGMSLNPFS